MTLFEQMQTLLEQSKQDGRTPVSWEILPDKLEEVEREADSNGALMAASPGGQRTIYGLPYDVVFTSNGQGVLLKYVDRVE